LSKENNVLWQEERKVESGALKMKEVMFQKNGGVDWKLQPPLPGSLKIMVRDGQHWVFQQSGKKLVLDKNHITATVTPVLPRATPSATPYIVPPEPSAPMSPAPADTIPSINTATGTLVHCYLKNDHGFPVIFFQGTRTLNCKGATGARRYGKSASHIRVTPNDTVCKDMALYHNPTTSSVTTNPSYGLDI
jgi:hypothetical protein